MPHPIVELLKPLPSGGGFDFTHCLHATSIAVDGKGLLITGPSGSGKSALALDILSRGGALVADDQTLLRAEHGTLIANAHPRIMGQIEARGLGVLKALPNGPTPIYGLVDLSQSQDKRLPNRLNLTLLGVELPLFLGLPYPHQAPALMQFLRHGWAQTKDV